DGHVLRVGEAEALLAELGDQVDVTPYADALIVPGFIDTHIHYPQTEIVAAYGEQLLQWLETYTFPAEARFEDPVHARSVAEVFLDELLRAGTTTALVFGTVHKASVEAFFEASEARNLRMIAGKVLMDRNAPDYLLDTPESGYEDSRALIEKWHNHGRARYAVTPRFSPTSTPEQLRRAGQLLQEFPDVYMHTHLSENKSEVAWVEELFPDCDGYLDTYDQAGLLGRRSIFAHCLHLSDREWDRLAETRSNIAFCPTSNLFLGSGLFQLSRALKKQLRVGLGTDIGGGTSFSILQTLSEAYKVLALQGEKLSPFKGFYLATLGSAQALDLADVIGNFETGKEADFVILDKHCTPLMDFRMRHCKDLFEELFVFTMLGDDRVIRATYAAGQCVHAREQKTK
ncbi:MAG: guanine deaminase, partial [Proteobacteria bacterium]|nr:guanine deaminase [Pseudomonadota bacterium]